MPPNGHSSIICAPTAESDKAFLFLFGDKPNIHKPLFAGKCQPGLAGDILQNFPPSTPHGGCPFLRRPRPGSKPSQNLPPAQRSAHAGAKKAISYQTSVSVPCPTGPQGPAWILPFLQTKFPLRLLATRTLAPSCTSSSANAFGMVEKSGCRVISLIT